MLAGNIFLVFWGERELMNIQVWCKSFLSIYNVLPMIVSSIDKIIYLKSVNSSSYNFDALMGTENQIKNIVNLTQKKVNLINLKVLTDETLVDMSEEKSKLIVLRFIDNIESKNAIKILGLSRRTYFRRLNEALSEFEHVFYTKLIKNKLLYRELKNEEFLEDIFNKIDTFNKSVKEIETKTSRVDISHQLCSYLIKSIKRAF